MATPKEMMRAHDENYIKQRKLKPRPKMRHYVDSETGKPWRETKVFQISPEWNPDKFVWSGHRAFLYEIPELSRHYPKQATHRWFVPKKLVEAAIVLPGDLVAAHWLMGYNEPWGDQFVSWPLNLLVGTRVDWYGHENELQRPKYRMLVRGEETPITLEEALKRAGPS